MPEMSSCCALWVMSSGQKLSFSRLQRRCSHRGTRTCTHSAAILAIQFVNGEQIPARNGDSGVTTQTSTTVRGMVSTHWEMASVSVTLERHPRDNCQAASTSTSPWENIVLCNYLGGLQVNLKRCAVSLCSCFLHISFSHSQINY